VIRGNTITTNDGTGIMGSVSDDGLVVDANTVRGSKTPVALQALQDATVTNNDLRDPEATYCVYEWGIDPDESTTIRPSDDNTITGNDCRGVTNGVVYHLNAVDGVGDTVSGNLWP
jgi:Right handed beta helix region